MWRTTAAIKVLHMYGQNFSSNVEPLNEELAEELNNIPMFDLIKIDCAMVRGDRVILTDIEHKAISNKDGNAIAISGPLTAPGVQVLEELRPELLQVWGIRFGDEVDVVFNAKTLLGDMDNKFDSSLTKALHFPDI